jgi:hypothetical protein
MEGYLESNLTALTKSVVDHYGLSPPTAQLVQNVSRPRSNRG